MLSFYILLEGIWLIDSILLFFPLFLVIVMLLLFFFFFCSLRISEICFVIIWCMEDKCRSQTFAILSIRGDFYLCVFKCIHNILNCNIFVHMWFIIFTSTFNIFNPPCFCSVWFLIAPYKMFSILQSQGFPIHLFSLFLFHERIFR